MMKEKEKETENLLLKGMNELRAKLQRDTDQ